MKRIMFGQMPIGPDSSHETSLYNRQNTPSLSTCSARESLANSAPKRRVSQDESREADAEPIRSLAGLSNPDLDLHASELLCARSLTALPGSRLEPANHVPRQVNTDTLSPAPLCSREKVGIRLEHHFRKPPRKCRSRPTRTPTTMDHRAATLLLRPPTQATWRSCKRCFQVKHGDGGTSCPKRPGILR